MQPLFICKPEGILTVTVFGKSLRNQLGLQKWNTLIPGVFAHAMALNVKESKAFDSPSPLTQSLRQIMFYCNIKRAHYWRRREVVTWNNFSCSLKTMEWHLLCHIMQEDWEEHETRWKNPPFSGKEELYLDMDGKWKQLCPSFLLHLALRIVIRRSPEKKITELTHSLACLSLCYKFSDIESAVTGLQTHSIRWRKTQKHHLLY